METGLNLKAIKGDLDSSEWEEVEPGRQERRTFLGTVFHLMPSGKFYTPWACGNVTDEEAERDQEWLEKAEEELGTIDACLEGGEGDPCDLFAAQSRDVEEDEEDGDV